MSESEKQNEALLDLAQPRIIALSDRGKTYLLGCRRVTDSDWREYLLGGTVTSESNGKERFDTVETDTPFIELAERVLTSATGYAVTGGGAITDLPNWQKKVPLAHRRMVGYTLADVGPSAAGDLTIDPEVEVISLDATWSGLGGADGMMKYFGLLHFLKTPSEAQYRRYANESSRRRVIGGSRSGKTVYSNASMILLAEMYDDLIVRVDGYSVNGSKLEGAENIAREMDMFHKIRAAQELFAPSSAVKLAGGEEG
jgi:hypothetical protein